MTRASSLTINGSRAAYVKQHWARQANLHHWVPGGEKPRLGSSYRAARRNASRGK